MKILISVKLFDEDTGEVDSEFLHCERVSQGYEVAGIFRDMADEVEAKVDRATS